MASDQSGAGLSVDFDALFSGADPAAAPRAPLEVALEGASGEVAVVDNERFQFRSLLDPDQLASMQAGAPKLANKVAEDLNVLLSFGAPIMQRVKDSSTRLLEAQRDIKVPQADKIVNEMMREMDGFERQYRNSTLADAVSRFKGFFNNKKYTFQTLVRESKPIGDRLDLTEVRLAEMEQQLAENITRGQILHKQSLEHLDQVVAVLAALEEVLDILNADLSRANELISKAEATNANKCEWNGKAITLGQLREVQADLVTAVSEVDKTWHDWRTQFFMSFANAPTTRNLVMTQLVLRRRLASFRTMGIPQAKRSLVMWQQAVLAKEGAEIGESIQAGVNKLIQQSFGATAASIEHVAKAAQAPIITEESIWEIVDSVRDQCRAIVAADTAGRTLRERNLRALESGEVTIKDEFANVQQKLVANAG